MRRYDTAPGFPGTSSLKRTVCHSSLIALMTARTRWTTEKPLITGLVFNPLKAECLKGQSTLAGPQCGAIIYALAELTKTITLSLIVLVQSALKGAAGFGSPGGPGCDISEQLLAACCPSSCDRANASESSSDPFKTPSWLNPG